MRHVLCTRFDGFCCSMLLPTGNSRIPCLSTPHFSPHTCSAGIYGPSPASIYSFWSVQLLPPAHRSHWNPMLLFPPPVYNLRLQPLVFPLHWYPALTLTLWCVCVGPPKARQMHSSVRPAIWNYSRDGDEIIIALADYGFAHPDCLFARAVSSDSVSATSVL